MQKKLTSAFIIALMLASCLTSALIVSDTDDADPILISPAPSSEDGFVIGETYAIHSVYDNERLFDELNELLHKNGPALLDMIYEFVNENLDEKMTKEEFKTVALDVISQLAEIGYLSEDTASFLTEFIQHPGMVNFNYVTAVAFVNDLCKVLSLFLTIVSEETVEISVEEFNFEVYSDVMSEITRLSTYEFQLAQFTEFTIAFNLILDLNGEELKLEDAKMTFGVASMLWFSQAPKDATYKLDLHTWSDFSGRSNFICQNEQNIPEFIMEPGDIKDFDMNVEVDTTAELSIYPGIDFPFFDDRGKSTINLNASIYTDIVSNMLQTDAQLAESIYPISKNIDLDIPVDVVKTRDGAKITNDEWGLSILMTKGPIEFSIDNDYISLDLKFNGKDALSIDLAMASEYGTTSLNILYENGALMVKLNGIKLIEVTKDEMTIDPKDYYGKDLTLTDEEVAMLNADMEMRAKACGHPEIWREIPIGDLITAEFFIDSMGGAVQTEQLIAGGLVSTPGFFLYDGKVVLEWIAEGGLVYNYYDTYSEDVAFYGKELIVLDDVPAAGEMFPKYNYALISGETLFIPNDSMTPGATLTVIAPDMSWRWTLGAVEGDDLSETVLDIGVKKINPLNSSQYVADVIGDRKAICLDLSASGTMPSISALLYYTELEFSEGQQLDVYCDTGSEIVFMDTYTTNGGCVVFDVPHCSTYIIAEHADQGSNNTPLIIAIIVILLIVIVVAIIFMKKKKASEN